MQKIDIMSAYHNRAETGMLGGEGPQFRPLCLAMPSDGWH